MDKAIMNFDRRDDFDAFVKDHLDEVSRICSELHIPFYFCACTSNTADADGKYQPTYFRLGRTPAAYNGTIPGNDEVSRHYAVSLGAQILNECAEDVDVRITDAEEENIEELYNE